MIHDLMSDTQEWYFTKHVPCLPSPHCFSVQLYFVWARLCPHMAQILSPHNGAVAARAGDAQRDLWMMCLAERHSICFDRDFTFCSVQQHMSNDLGSHPRDCLFCSVGWSREWIPNSCSDHAETIVGDTIWDLDKDKLTYLWIFIERGRKCVLTGFGRSEASRETELKQPCVPWREEMLQKCTWLYSDPVFI